VASITTDSDGSQPPVSLLNKWTNRAMAAVIPPLVLWGAASVFNFATAFFIPWYWAWIPAMSTSGVMLVSSQIAMERKLDSHIRLWASALAVAAVIIETIVAGTQHILTFDAAHPPHKAWMFLVCALPTTMGAATFKIWSMVHAAEEALRAEAEQAARDAIAARQRAAEQEETRRQTAVTENALAAQRRTAELHHQQELARLATEQAKAQAALRQTVATVEAAVSTTTPPPPAPTPVASKPASTKPERPRLVPAPPTGPVDALGRPARPSPKRDAALSWLVTQHKAGRDLSKVTAAEVDRAIESNAYARKYLIQWIADVHKYVGRGAA
jgi:hypothetical protein